jgi:superfamily II DNA or RNA helicase
VNPELDLFSASQLDPAELDAQDNRGLHAGDTLASASRRPRAASVAAAENLSPTFPKRAPWGAASKLRKWQQEALDIYREKNPRDFLAVATPGAGKTTFALRLATELLDARVIRKITVVAPTEHLKHQWADSAARVGIRLDSNYANGQGRLADHYDGVALTYAQVAANPQLHANRTENARTLVILDEVHHGGDALSWGEALHVAFDSATRRLCLTGTPFRSDTAPIPFVPYEKGPDGIRRSVADYTYGYGQALRDHVVRPVIFMSYAGQMRWRTKAGDEIAASLGEAMTKDMTSQAWRTALDPQGEWIKSVLAAADKRLTEVRRAIPDAGGLVIASDQADARAYAGHLSRITGESPTVVLSDDTGAGKRIEEFSDDKSRRWMVAVRMVSEGVDVPRLAVGVYATSTQTPLFFAQAVGRYVRARKRGETASIFLPSVAPLLALANSMEEERDHALDRPKTEEESPLYDPEEALTAAANREEKASNDLEGSFEMLEAHASFDKVLFDGGEFGAGADVGSQEELDFLGLPGLLDADQVSTLLRQHQHEHLSSRSGKARAAEAERSEFDHRRAASLRKELQQLVNAWARRSGQPHGVVHTELRKRSGGPEVPQASLEQLEKRVATVRGWFVGKK